MIKLSIPKLWKKKIYISLVALIIVSGAGFLYISKVHADPVTYYFNNAVNQSPAEQGNYWYDEIMSDPALELPNFAVDYVTVTSGVIFDGDAVFHGNSINHGQVTGNAVFYDTALNNGQINGNAEFFGTSINGGWNGANIAGNATFNDDSQSMTDSAIQGNGFFYDNAIDNGSGISLDATFYGDLSENTGFKNSSGVLGTQSRYYTQATTTIRDFTLRGPWTVVADGVVVDVTNAIFDGTTTFVEENGGSFVGAEADPITLYFNNAVSSNPAEPGNYWQDNECTIQAIALPNFAIDEVFIPSGYGACSSGAAGTIVFDGDITFNGNATNQGTVTGNAIFNDSSQNLTDVEGAVVMGNATFNDNSLLSGGTIQGNATFNGDNSDAPHHGGSVSGTKTRRYTSNITTTRSFTSDGPWTVVADGAIVDVSGASIDGGTIFQTQNGGSFIFPTPTLSSGSARVKTVTLTYDLTLDTASTPATSDFLINVNGTVTAVSAVSVSGSSVNLSLSLEDDLSTNDVVIVDYNPGINPIQSSLGADAVALNDSPVTVSTFINLNANVGQSVSVGTEIYVISDSNVKVIDSITDTPIATIAVGASPQQLIVLGTRIYVPNYSSSNVTVIDTLTHSAVTNIALGANPFGGQAFGTKVYINIGVNNTVAVINTLTNTVSSIINVGVQPRSSIVVGTKLYVNNYGGSSITVIDLLTDTVLSTISVGITPHDSAVIGYKLYVLNGSNQIKVIDTRTDLVISTITPGSGLIYTTAVIGTKLYVSHHQNGQVNVISSATDSVTATINIGFNPKSIFAVNNKLVVGPYLNAGTDLVIIDYFTNAISDTIGSQAGPQNFAAVGSKLYVANTNSTGVTMLNLKSIISELPNLVSFSTSSPSGNYGVGDLIQITAHFARALQAGSTMTVSLNSGASVVLNTLSGGSLSGNYTVASSDASPDLAVTEITSASVTDLGNHTRTSYTLPSTYIRIGDDFVASVRNMGDTKDIVIGSYQDIAVAEEPYSISQAILVNDTEYIYTVNKGSNSVSAIRSSDSIVTNTITVGTEPIDIASVNIAGITYLYVTNSGSNTVSVIDTQSNVIVATIAVGYKPMFITASDSSVYVGNGGEQTVSVINPLSNTVLSTIRTGLNPRGMEIYNGNLYIANFGNRDTGAGSFVSIINTTTNTLTGSILLPTNAFGSYALTINNGFLYLANYVSDTISVINLSDNSYTANINVSGGPRALLSSNGFVYTSVFDGGMIWVINPATNLVSSIVNVGHSPMGMTRLNNYIYFTRFQDDSVSILNTTSNALQQPSTSGGGGGGGGGGGSTSTPPVIPVAPSDPNAPEIPNPGTETETETPASQKIDPALTERLKGKLLLAVEDRGKIWYLDPVSGKRYQVRLDNALTIFRRFALGITDANLAQVPVAPSAFRITALANRLKGMILLQVEKMGFTWYVDTSGKRHLITVFTVLDVFKKLSLGITNENLNKIEIGNLE